MTLQTLQDEERWYDLKVMLQVVHLEARNEVDFVRWPCIICGRETLVRSDQVERFPYCGTFGCLHDLN